jgi:hypothetical protein
MDSADAGALPPATQLPEIEGAMAGIRKALDNVFVLIAEGFALGAVLVWATGPAAQPPPASYTAMQDAAHAEVALS